LETTAANTFHAQTIKGNPQFYILAFSVFDDFIHSFHGHARMSIRIMCHGLVTFLGCTHKNIKLGVFCTYIHKANGLLIINWKLILNIKITIRKP
jgi:hypothetical protein